VDSKQVDKMDEIDDAFDPGNRGTSALPNYDADGGMKDFGANVIVHYTPWQKWGVMGMPSYSSLFERRRQPAGRQRRG
jgi:hypothetical protein